MLMSDSNQVVITMPLLCQLPLAMIATVSKLTVSARFDTCDVSFGCYHDCSICSKEHNSKPAEA